MDKVALKKKVCSAIDDRAEEIRRIKLDIWANPELGYKEHRTAEKVAEAFQRIGLPYSTGHALTGVRAELEGTRETAHPFKVAILGELDAVLCWDHENSDRKTGAVHACGHDAQVAAMLGAAIGLADSGAADHLAGNVVFFGVPAEEFVELEYRQGLREQGEIEFFGGKQEFVRLGLFDDIDIAEMIHVQADSPGRRVHLSSGSNGFVGKTVRYLGKEAHAGATPHLGVNALNAALLGLVGIHAQRETFRDEVLIRVHPIITRGGDLVNIVPADVRMETYVRGARTEAIFEANKKVNRALLAGGMAVGAECVITEIPGYLPLAPSAPLADVFAANTEELLGADSVKRTGFSGGSTDMGDLSHLIPSIHPYVGGISGSAHARTFKVADLDMVTVIPAKILAMTAVDLLWDDASLGRSIKSTFTPAYTKDEYLAMWRRFSEGS